MFETGNPALNEQAAIASVTDRVRSLSLGGAAGAVYFIGDTTMFVGAEEAVTIVGGDDHKRVDAASGGILSSATDGKRVVLGSDDGRVISVGVDGVCETLVTDAKRRWIDQVALHSDGSLAWSAGKTAFVKQPKGEAKSFDAPSSVGGLAFAPKGFRLAVAHYNGVSLWFPNMAAAPEFLEWKGSHLAVTFSPDGRFLVTSMHESALHGWRLADNKHMRMTGYPGRVRSLSWTAGGKFLATSGADSAILWPFASKDGPMGKEPSMLAPMPSRVSAVAAHPKHEIVAVGFADGTVLMVRIEDGAEILVRRNEGKPVTALGWNAKGTLLAFADEAGEGGLLPL
jgi:WD40 repeat protein